MKTYGQLLTEIRRDAGLTQRELAKACGVNHTYLSKIEHDAMRPSWRLNRQLQVALVASDGQVRRLNEALGICPCCGQKLPED